MTHSSARVHSLNGEERRGTPPRPRARCDDREARRESQDLDEARGFSAGRELTRNLLRVSRPVGSWSRGERAPALRRGSRAGRRRRPGPPCPWGRWRRLPCQTKRRVSKSSRAAASGKKRSRKSRSRPSRIVLKSWSCPIRHSSYEVDEIGRENPPGNAPKGRYQATKMTKRDPRRASPSRSMACGWVYSVDEDSGPHFSRQSFRIELGLHRPRVARLRRR